MNFYTNSYDIDLCLKMSHIYFDRVKIIQRKLKVKFVLWFCCFFVGLFVFAKSNYLAILCFPILLSWGDKGREDASTFTFSLISFVLYLLQHFFKLMGDLVTLG